MAVLTRIYNVAAGSLKFDFTYAAIVSGGFLDDLDILHIGELNYGYDNENNIDLSVYPTNIDIVIDDQTGDNYTRFSKLINSYKQTYPYNLDVSFKLEITLDDEIIFKGFLDELSSDKDSWHLTLKFVDGINKYKDSAIANPHVLKKLWDREIIKGRRWGSSDSIAYGFGELGYITVIGHPEKTGYYVNDIITGDRDTKLLNVITQLFKLLNDEISVDFDIQYSFRDILSGSETVDITRVHIRRILSNLLGRYVALRKYSGYENKIVFKDGNPDYTREGYFEAIYEDDQYKVYKHTYSGHVGSYKFEKGTDDKTIGDFLKTLAYNLFSYFGFRDPQNVFFRHRRYLSDPVELTDVISMNKILSVDKVQGTLITDYYSGNYAKKGSEYGGSGLRTISYKIPLNSFVTDNSFEYRLNYYQKEGGTTVEKRVIYFNDLQLGVEDTPQEVLSMAEWEAHKDYRDKYGFVLSGINYAFDSTYSVNQFNYQGKFRPIELSKNLLENKTTLKAIQID